MNDSDQSTAAASGPHHPQDDQPLSDNVKPGLLARLRSRLGARRESLRDNLQNALQQTASQDVQFTDGERAMISNVLNLANMRVDDVMVPRADIEAVDRDESLGEALNVLRQAGHSRVPVYEENLDHIVGMIHIKDLVQRLSEPVGTPNGSPLKLLSGVLKQKIKTQDFLRRVLFVPPSMPVTDLLQTMQANRVHMAIVVDEYGGTDGLATIEDLLEAVVGDIEDEHDDEEAALITAESENIFRADARATLQEVRAFIGPDFDLADYEEEADTLGGLVFSLIDRVPVKGEVISKFKGFDFEILQADPRRVRRVRIIRRTRLQKVRAVQRAEEKPATPPLQAPESAEPAEPVPDREAKVETT